MRKKTSPAIQHSAPLTVPRKVAKKFSPYSGIPKESKLAKDIRSQIEKLQTELYKIEDDQIFSKFKDFEGKFFRISNDPNTLGSGNNLTTYYKFGKYDKTGKFFNCEAVVLGVDGRYRKSYNYQYTLYNLDNYFPEMTELSAIDWKFIMKDALEQFVMATKATLGIE